MSTFTLDTSGEVLAQRASSGGPFAFHWSDLDPFTQGYVEALMGTVQVRNAAGPRLADGQPVPAFLRNRFSDLSPEALAAILGDCQSKVTGALDAPNGYEGCRFWQRRQAGEDAYFPPLTPTLGDDGKVHLDTIERAEAGR